MSTFVLPVRPEAESFSELVAEQLRKAPWLAVSTLGHALILVLAWLLLPASLPDQPPHAVSVVPLDETPVEVPPVPVPPVPVAEPTPEVVDAKEPNLEQSSDSDAVSDVDADAMLDSDLPSADAFNVTVGLHGPKFGGPKGNGRGTRGTGGPMSRIAPALDWLARHQDADGRWDADQFMKHDMSGTPCDGAGNAVHDVGVTALALMAFVGDGNSMRGGQHRDVVRRAVGWLRGQQDESGRFGPASSSDFIYDHAIATYALCETYGYSQYKLLAPIAQRGVHYLQAHRNPYGAWRYQPRDGDNDVSVTCWAIMALASALHWGLEVDRSALASAQVFLESCTSPDGHCGYSRAGEASARKPGDHASRFPVERGEAMTAAALFCRYFLGQDLKEEASMRGAVQRLLAKKPSWDSKAGSIDHYYWYYASYALYQVGGAPWREWSQALEKALVKTQRGDGNFAGSWDPAGVWGEDGGRVYSTAILALTLQAYYRYGRLVPLAGK